ncbi:hypothetical protein BS47DRAFT_1343746 [Hydnum rufescens UP504]|uniref:Peptidase A1 domain-containing protein n=1 Tax=Hydnum rufescens UP504 TaxID=1448309 RepID=A0A9P6AZQ5_9AGAM|nr:hypothetical protein BS47DRAFT_1343746 [Hydnum rufescens UP504]
MLQHCKHVLLLTLCCCLFSTITVAHIQQTSSPSRRGVHVPIYARDSTALDRRSLGSGSIGLGDYQDIAYNVLVRIGNISLPLLLDSGSADLWTIADTCKNNCTRGLPVYPHKSFNYSGVDARLFYGDTATGTYAFGPVGKDTVNIAGVAIQNQYFAAINETDTNVVYTNSVGLLGLGFPVNSVIWNALFIQEYPAGANTTITVISTSITPTPSSPSIYKRSTLLRDNNYVEFGDMKNLATVDQLLATFITNGPVVARMGFSGLLAEPSFTITLQRDSLDIGGNIGMLSLGELPPGVLNNSLTWVPIRLYTSEEGGIPSSPAAPNEVPIDNVYLDGQALPQSTLSTGVSLSALIDTGNSLIRGPRDVVATIYERISGSNTTSTYDCLTPHTLEFSIGGQKFPIDPRDFGWQAAANSIQTCNASIVATDPPSKGFLYAWSLGDPFLKSVLASFYYGNLTHPSVDPPRLGFVSTVPQNAAELLIAAVKSSINNFPAIIEPPLNGTPNASQTGVAGVALAPTLPALPSSVISPSASKSADTLVTTKPSVPSSSPTKSNGTRLASSRLDICIGIIFVILTSSSPLAMLV